MQLSALGSAWSTQVDGVQGALQANNPPLSIAGSAVYKGGTGSGDLDENKYLKLYPEAKQKYPKSGTPALQHYVFDGYAAGATFTPTDAWQAKYVAAQFQLADFYAQQALAAAGLTGGDFDADSFAAQHQGDPAWYSSWSPWEFYKYYGLAQGYPFPKKGAGSTAVAPAASAAAPASGLVSSGATVQSVRALPNITPQQIATNNPYGLVAVVTGDGYAWKPWLISQRPDLNGAVIILPDAVAMDQAYQTWLAAQSATALPPPVSSSATVNTAATPAVYSPYQTNYAVVPGIPDTGEPGVPGTGSGAPSAPLTYDQVQGAVQSAASPSAPKTMGLGWLLVVAAGGYLLFGDKAEQWMKKQKAKHAAR